MEILINRESVCLGDDVSDHQRPFVFTDNATYMDLIERILSEKYLPSVSGNNVVWVLSSKEYSDILSYYTRTQKVFEGLTIKHLSELCNEDNKLYFRYFPSPQERKNYIDKLYNSNTYNMWHDGWLDEYRYCDYVTALNVECNTMEDLITLCGDNCRECPRYNAHSAEELKKVAELWYRVGWRDKVVSNEEIQCTGCSSHKQCTYELVECTKEHKVEKCNQCNYFPCNKINDMLNRSEKYRSHCREVCTDEEFIMLVKSFFNKEENLKK